MNYNRIKTELERRGITIKDFCRKVDLTEQGLHQMIRNGSMKVDVLERISDELDVPVSFWFDEPTVDEPSKPSPKISDSQRIDNITSELNTFLKTLAEKKTK